MCVFVCVDVNECEVYGTCPQQCKNSKGSYECFCAPGFRTVGEQHGLECAAEGEGKTDAVHLRHLPLHLTILSSSLPAKIKTPHCISL